MTLHNSHMYKYETKNSRKFKNYLIKNLNVTSKTKAYY